MKRCIKCKRELDFIFFSKSQSRCKECLSEYWKEWSSKQENKIRLKERDIRQNKSATKLAYRRTETYRADARRRSKDYYWANKPLIKEKRKKYIAENLDKFRLYEQNRRAKMGTKITKQDWEQVLNYYGYCCVYCFSPDNLTIEHIIPLARGGEHSVDNIAPACKSCNCRKNKKTPLEFLRVK